MRIGCKGLSHVWNSTLALVGVERFDPPFLSAYHCKKCKFATSHFQALKQWARETELAVVYSYPLSIVYVHELLSTCA